MKLTIPEFIVSPSSDWVPFPGSINVQPGQHRFLITGKLQSHSITTGQCFVRPNFDQGGPNIGAVVCRRLLLQGDPEGLGYDGSFAPDPTLNAIGSIAGVAPTVQPFIFDIVATVTLAGELTLLANVTEVAEGPTEVVTFRDVEIEVLPA